VRKMRRDKGPAAETRGTDGRGCWLRLSLTAVFVLTTGNAVRGQQALSWVPELREPPESHQANLPKKASAPTSAPGNSRGEPGPTSTQAKSPASLGPFASALTQNAAAGLTLEEAIRLALAQASDFQQARLNEMIAGEDVRQARLAFLPRAVTSFSPIYNSPARGSIPPGAQREMSFINANAIAEYEALAGVVGELDLTGRLRATLRRNAALLEAAHAGTEVARRALVQAVREAYYGVSLAHARRRSAEQTLEAAEEFERITGLMVEAGEVAEVDLIRGRLQTSARRDDLEQSRAVETVAEDGLRALIGYDFTAALETSDLNATLPEAAELDRFLPSSIANRPEFGRIDAERRAAQQELNIARAERLPQVSYYVNGGFDTDAFSQPSFRTHSGVLAGLSVVIPIFDWGSRRSRERQARLRMEMAESERQLATRGFSQQFHSARAQALSAAARAGRLRGSVVDAERNVQTSIARYRAGEAPILEVTDAQTTLAAQRAALFEALFDYQIARVRLAQAAGQ
jgi:outer membrane protein